MQVGQTQWTNAIKQSCGGESMKWDDGYIK